MDPQLFVPSGAGQFGLTVNLMRVPAYRIARVCKQAPRTYKTGLIE